MKIDAVEQLATLEEVLRSGVDIWSCRHAVAVLRRWVYDEMLTRETRLYARNLLERFGNEVLSQCDR